jgi:hypothetical protein
VASEAEIQEGYRRLRLKLEDEAEKQKEKLAKKAGHKIQLWFKSDRKLHGDVAFSLSFWESGKRMHGGGDEMMFVCRRHVQAPKVQPFEVVSPKTKAGPRGCDGLIPGGLVQAGRVICPHCQTHHHTEQIGDSIFYRTTMSKAADILAYWWRKLNCDADIYVKYTPADPRVILMGRAVGLEKARRLKGLTVYPLERIIKDTAAGSTVESRFKALLTA